MTRFLEIPNSQKSNENLVEFRLYFKPKPSTKEKTVYNSPTQIPLRDIQYQNI